MTNEDNAVTPAKGETDNLMLALAIGAIVKAIQGECWRIPLIADLADKW